LFFQSFTQFSCCLMSYYFQLFLTHFDSGGTMASYSEGSRRTVWLGPLISVRQQQNRYDKNGVDNRTDAQRRLQGVYRPDRYQEGRRDRSPGGANFRPQAGS